MSQLKILGIVTHNHTPCEVFVTIPNKLVCENEKMRLQNTETNKYLCHICVFYNKRQIEWHYIYVKHIRNQW